ncbi:hypothetical protein FRC18_011716 [Serendipita sp. 400]|nr:hypothetical protein FRC18_011716 [Serendipita sp. 400]
MNNLKRFQQAYLKDTQSDVLVSGMLGLGPLACRNRVPSHSERLRLRSILGIQSKVVDSLDEAIASAEKAFNEACHRCQKLWEEFESAQTEVLSAQKVIEMLRAQKSSLFEESPTRY